MVIKVYDCLSMLQMHHTSYYLVESQVDIQLVHQVVDIVGEVVGTDSDKLEIMEY